MDSLFSGAAWRDGKSSSGTEEKKRKMENHKQQKRPKLRKYNHSKTMTTKKHSNDFFLSIELMTRPPHENFKLWDESEIVPLEKYREQFALLHPENKKNKHFYDNWVNCDRAIHYFYNEINPKWKSMVPSMPLKQAIRTGNAIPLHENQQLTLAETKRILQTANEELSNGQTGIAKQLLKEDKQATLTVSEYLEIKKGPDEEYKKLLDQNKYDEKILNLVHQRMDPCPIEEFDPRNPDHKIECIPEGHRAQFIIDKELEEKEQKE